MFVLVSVLGRRPRRGPRRAHRRRRAELAKAGAPSPSSALPREVETPPPAEGSTVYMADGSVLTNFFDENRAYVPLSEISPAMKQAQLAVEDQRFYAHGALDFRGTLRALVRTSSGNTQGGSTLTQQYVKLALIDKAVADNDKEGIAAAYDRTFARKLLELRYAIALEERSARTRSSSATSTSPTTGPAPTASRRPPSATSTSRPRTSPSPRPRCSPASSATRPPPTRSATRRSPSSAATTCSTSCSGRARSRPTRPRRRRPRASTAAGSPRPRTAASPRSSRTCAAWWRASC